MRETRISEALRAAAGRLSHRPGSGQWTFSLPGSATAAARASLDGGWLVLQVPVGNLAGEGAWAWLRRNTHLDGTLRFCLPAGGAAGVWLRDTIRLGAGQEAGMGRRVRSVCRSVTRTLAGLPGEGRTAAPQPPPAPAWIPPVVVSLQEVEVLCEQAGWRVRQAEEGRLRVDRENAASPCRASLEARQDGTLRGEVILARSGPLAPASREALGRLFLQLTASLRVARGGTAQSRRGHLFFIEARVALSEGAALLRQALADLALACEQCVPETGLLFDPVLARLYLRSSGDERAIRREREPETERTAGEPARIHQPTSRTRPGGRGRLDHGNSCFDF